MPNVLTDYDKKLLDIALKSNAPELQGKIFNKHGWNMGVKSQADYDILKEYNFDVDAYGNDPRTPMGNKLSAEDMKQWAGVTNREISDKYGTRTGDTALHRIVYNEMDDETLFKELNSLGPMYEKDASYRQSEAENNAKRKADVEGKAWWGPALMATAGAILTGGLSTAAAGAIGLGGVAGAGAALTAAGQWAVSDYSKNVGKETTMGQSAYNGRSIDTSSINSDGYTAPENPFTTNPNVSSPVVGSTEDVLKLQEQGNIQTFDSLNKGGSFEFQQSKGRPFGQSAPETAFLKETTSSFGTVDEQKSGGTTFRWA